MYQREKKSRHTKSPHHYHTLGNVHIDPNVSATIGSSVGNHFVSRLQHLLLFGLDLLYGIKSSPLHLNFHLGKEKEEVTGG